MKRQDEFLILGFTGAFSSGCTTASQFFLNGLSRAKKDFIAAKSKTNSDIANFYKQRRNEIDREEAKKERTKKILKLARKRQIINALEKVEDVPFFYISMTDIMHSLVIEYCVTNGTKLSPVPDRFKDVVDLVLQWCKDEGLDSESLIQIGNALRVRDIDKGNDEKVFVYLKKLKLFRKRMNDLYRDNSFNLFDTMQTVGNNLRKCGKPFVDEKEPFGDPTYLDILSERAGEVLKFHRKWKKRQNSPDHRTYYLIECLRNPSEVDYFRKRFHEFYLFSVYADEGTRHERARKNYKLSEDECVAIDNVDQGGDYLGEPYKQNVKRCVYLADIALTNCKEFHDLHEELLRYYVLIKHPGCIKPTHTERNMNLAYSMSLNSTCICRQVGAVIINKSFVVGAGWNDTGGGRLGCVYRLRRDVVDTKNEEFPICSERDHGLFQEIIVGPDRNLDHSFCYKDEIGELKKEIARRKGTISDGCKEVLEDVETRSLQYCRALHAEENAILQTAKIGGRRLHGSTLYTTTFPCELCAKKILQVDIKRVVYCEPYPKSVSMDVFFKETMAKVEIVPFEGVKSPSFFRLFKPPFDIKDLQQLEAIETGLRHARD